MNKYFELKFWLTIIGISLVVVSIVIFAIYILISIIINAYRSKSKKLTYNCLTNKWEKVEKQ